MSTKGCSAFSFYLDLELLIKMQKNECVETRSFLFLKITQDLDKIKRNPGQPFADVGK